MKQRIAIIGGGISGLTAAYVLERDHADTCDITLFEASDRFGGIIETVRTGGFTIECGPDSWVTEKPWAEQLARELGLADELLPSNDRERRTYIARNNMLTPLPDAMRMMAPTNLGAVLASPLFSEAAKEAYRQEPARASELRASALAVRGGDESVAAFVERHFGPEVVSTVAGPLLAGVFGGDIYKLSAHALLGPFVALEAEYGSLVAGLQHRPTAARPVFTTLVTGLETLVKQLVKRLPRTSLHPGTPVRYLRRIDAGWFIDTGGGQYAFDRVLIAASLDTTRALLASLDIASARRAAALLPSEASSSLIVALAYNAGALLAPSIPSGFGLLVAPDYDNQQPPLLACTFLHQKFARRAPEGAALLRAFFGSTAADQLSSQTDEQIVAAAWEQLSILLGPLPERADVTLVRRWPRSLPQYEVGHGDRMTQFKACLQALPDLAVIGNALRGVGLPDLVRDAIEAAHVVALREPNVVARN